MSKEFKVGQTVRVGNSMMRDFYMRKGLNPDCLVVDRLDYKNDPIMKGESNTENYGFRSENFDQVERASAFTAGNKLRITFDGFHPARMWGKGAVVEFIEYSPSAGRQACRVKTHDGVLGIIDADRLERIEEQPQPEPATEFRIRKHGTALREVRGIPFATQQEAEQAVSRYTPGSVYEIVEVKVVRTVKVEQEVRVIDYKEAA
ncbi:hypothetical protein [Burkholderia ubonensis]|uniref:hypothetical protein n=1 Tax=Burkholderia ubonensis TaxID=101571 RepID=UPI000A8F51BA|nr:hypothetical protein [Burkholderia ubonensis]